MNMATDVDAYLALRQLDHVMLLSKSTRHDRRTGAILVKVGKADGWTACVIVHAVHSVHSSLRNAAVSIAVLIP